MLAASVLAACVLQPVDSLAALRDALRAARPGDRITLAPGAYDGSLSLPNIRGEQGKPIVIAGADPAKPPVIRGRGSSIHLIAPAWVTIENLILEGASGNGINIDDGGDKAHPAPGVTLRNLHVRDVGPDGNSDGIKLSGLTDFTVESCTIERWGSGGSGIDMVGCRDGLIVGCTLRHADTVGSSGIQLKGGTRDTVVRACRFEHAGSRAINIGGSTGLQYFRPEPRGYEAAAITVEGCTIIGSECALAFVGVDGAIVRFNTVYHPTRWVFRILQETRAPGFVPSRKGDFTDNLLVFDIPGARNPNIGDATDPASFTFARNVWFCDTDAAASEPNLPSVETAGIYALDPNLRDPAHGNFTPDPAGPALRTGAHALPGAK
ncbi:hypothetical protein PHYC_01740 [Phycisphaerales bacterium]|nr:hypothetical protein PHYC_01740 [Phycisphaerales bacterium]